MKSSAAQRFSEATQSFSEEIIQIAHLLIEKAEKDERRNSAIHLAASKGNIDVFDYLVTKPQLSPFERNKYGFTAMHHAADSGHDDMVNHLVTCYKLSPNSKDICGTTPLHLAASRGHNSTVRLLLEKGANPEEKDDRGMTASFCAIHNCDNNTICLLLAKLGHDNVEAYLEAYRKGLINFMEELITDIPHLCDNSTVLLIKKGVVLEKKNSNSDTSFTPGYNRLTEIQHIAHLLIEKAKKDERRNSAIHLAASEGNIDVFDYLVTKRQLSPFALNKYGSTAMHHAADNGHDDMVNHLVTCYKLSPNSKDMCDTTPLHLAASRGHNSTVRLLLEKGANPEEKDDLGMTASDYAINNCDNNTVCLLLKLEHDNVEAVKELITSFSTKILLSKNWKFKL